MASWPTGIETIKELIAAGNLEKVAPSLEAAHGFLAQAAGHIDSAHTVANADPTARTHCSTTPHAKVSLLCCKHKVCVPPARADTMRSNKPSPLSSLNRHPARRSAPSRAYGETATKSSTRTTHRSLPRTSTPTPPSSAPCTPWPSTWSTPFQSSPIDDTDSSSPLPRTTSHHGLSECPCSPTGAQMSRAWSGPWSDVTHGLAQVLPRFRSARVSTSKVPKTPVPSGLHDTQHRQ